MLRLGINFYHRGLLKFVYFLDKAAMAVRGSQEKFALEFLSVIIKSWGRGGGDFYKIRVTTFWGKDTLDFAYDNRIEF